MNAANIAATGRPSPRPIFIVGYMHSGTTLLRSIIGNHPDVFSIRAETMFFEQLSHLLKSRFSNLHDDATFEEYVRFLVRKTTFDWPPLTLAESQTESTQFLPDEALTQQIVAGAKQHRDYVPAFSFVFRAIATAAGATHWIEKTPSHIFFIDEIVAGLPDARIIELVRDPRDVLASKKVRKHSDWSARYGQEVGASMQLTKGYDPLRDSIGWRAAVRDGAVSAQKFPGVFLRLRYEDLVSAPEDATRRICDHLELAYNPAMLNVGWSNTTAQTGKENKAGIDNRAVGKWRNQLSSDVVELCQMFNGSEMDELGYETVPSSATGKVKAPFWVARSGVDLVVRYTQLWRVRGMDYVQGMARNSFRRVGHLAKR